MGWVAPVVGVCANDNTLVEEELAVIPLLELLLGEIDDVSIVEVGTPISDVRGAGSTNFRPRWLCVIVVEAPGDQNGVHLLEIGCPSRGVRVVEFFETFFDLEAER